MRSKPTAKILLLCLLLSWSGVLRAEEPGQSINSFYKKLIDTLKGEDASAKALAALVGENRPIAEKCLAAIQQKEQTASPGSKAGYELLERKLSDALLLTTHGKDCSQNVIGALSDRLERQATDEDRIFFLQNILRLCPEKGADYHARLGDLYVNQAQFGMAVEAYRKALEKRDDKGVREALEEAQRRLDSYQKGKPLSEGALQDLKKDRQMSVERKWIRKIQPPNTIQTNRILFDEWSSAIKEQSLPELKAFGQALEREFAANPALSVSVEGHTDSRGSYDRNMLLSRQRAEAIKKYLVENFKIDVARLSTKGCGPDKPFAPKGDAEGWALNRRVEFTLSEQTQ
jgi:outer membrane protein OmpA-like peptidoglycan-associated protein